MKSSLGLGKYRDLLFAILLFIVLDLGILFFNFYASIQLERDASRMNASGELRMLTQQITKSLLTLQIEKKGELPIQTSMAQLNQGTAAFVQGLSSLKSSMTQDTEFTVFGLNPDELRDMLKKLEREWVPLEESIRPVIAAAEPTLEDIEIAATKAVARNIRLMALTNDLAVGVEAAANTKTERMRQIQIAAIVLALINFVYIVFKFLRRLNASDRVAEVARQETDDILRTVSEGLLLVKADGTIGSQLSASVHRLFMRDVLPGESFRGLLQGMLTKERAEEADSFLDLMFDPKVKPGLLAQLDPLREVQIKAPGDGSAKSRFVTFQMTQVREGGLVVELLVTVFDVTQKVQLERELAATQEAAKSDVDDLIRVLEQEPVLLQDFLLDARAKLSDLNQSMRSVGRRPEAYQALVDEAARLVHGIKGEGAALSLTAVARQAHLMENALAPLLKRRDLSGEDLIPIVFELSRVQDQVDRLFRVFSRIGRPASNASLDEPRKLDAMVGNLRSLSERVAQSLGKQVRLTAYVDEKPLPEHVERVLREALPQLVRNAVVHGIELPSERAKLSKPPVGELRLDIGRAADGLIEVTVSDDGRGIVVPEVRRRMAQLRSDSEQFTDSQVLGFIFDPHFSTATEVTEHAGRGVGLSLVRQIAEKAGAKLRVMTQPNISTHFVLKFGVA
ncbi:MAG TPA: ATP-binding protein [Polaromonas sp.]|uniref:type IV pili methyl-accepting chemotaxis transducer N-terminal domain-containing protein n=1 Tax=Polaromonas sp. TaxID=1869339 RepID=UPI002D5A4D48|nr:ATP-binding protein [Polaromonas sp.]HYW58837.1 ATP-binding protein [Polaromonas sp.]